MTEVLSQKSKPLLILEKQYCDRVKLQQTKAHDKILELSNKYDELETAIETAYRASSCNPLTHIILRDLLEQARHIAMK